jgi:hypothetical protein
MVAAVAISTNATTSLTVSERGLGVQWLVIKQREQMDGKCVAQRVRRDGLGEVGLVPHRPAGILHSGGGDRLTWQIAREQLFLRTVRAVVTSEDLQQLGRKHDGSRWRDALTIRRPPPGRPIR